MNLVELARRIGAEAKGPADRAIRGVRDIERLSPEQPLEDDFVYFVESESVLRRHPLAGPHGIVLTTPELADRFACALVAPPREVRLAFVRLLAAFDRRPGFPPGVDPAAHVHPAADVDASATILAGAVVMEGARIGARCVLYPNVVVEPHASIGEDSVLYPGVVVGHHCTLGRRVVVHGAAVLGADGFGFHDASGRRTKIPQVGTVEIADDVEIGAGCTIDRATIEATSIGEHTKLDDQVHVAHNCRIGRFVYIAGQSALGGSVVVGDGAMLSGMVCIRDHVRLAPGTVVMGTSGVVRDTEQGTAWFGTPARPARLAHRINASLGHLPELLARVRALEGRLNPPTRATPAPGPASRA